MAFCTRSERKIKLSNYENFPNNSGFFQTQKNNSEKNLINYKTHLITNFSKKRLSRANNKSKLEFRTPGPGAYNLNNSIANNINKHSHYSFDNTHLSNYSTIDVSVGNYNNKIGFLSKEERFKNLNNNINNNNNNISHNSNLESKKNNNIFNTQNIKNDILNINYNNKSIENLTKKKNNKKFFEIINKNKTNLLTGSLKRLLSIPSRKMNGYSYENKSPEIILNYLEKKENEIGPGYYNIKIAEKNNIIDWNKQINLKEKIRKIKEKNQKDFIEKMKKFGDEKIEKNNKNKINFYSNYIKNKNKKENFLKLIKINENEKKALINNKIKILKDEVPGPGYYENDINRSQIIFNKNKIQNFGNSLERNLFEENNKSSNNLLGPTTYFNQKNKFEKDKKINYFHFINKSLQRSVLSCKKVKNNNNNSNENLFEHLKNKNFIPGPGSYNLSKTFIKKSASEKELLHSHEKRNNIFNNIKNDNPGPGAYLSQNYFSEFNNNKIIENFYEEEENFLKQETNKIKEENEKRKNEFIKKNNENKNISPSPNDYLVDFYNSIEYFNFIKSRNKNNQKINGPFLISSLRFKNNSNNNINNFKEKNLNYNDFIVIENYNKNINKQFNKFNNSFLNIKKSSSFSSKLNRFEINKEEINKLGPGYYQIEKEFDWNKKTFNILFINQNKNIYK